MNPNIFFVSSAPISCGARFSSWYRLGFVVLVYVLQSFCVVSAQTEPNYVIHANIIYRFTKYIDWPDASKSGDFVIGVTGDTPLYEALRANIANKMVGEQKILIKRFSPSASLFNCHILFIGEDESRSIKKILINTSGNAVLIISESSGLASKGSCINFIIESQRLRLEINPKNIENRGLGIASELLKLGKIVK